MDNAVIALVVGNIREIIPLVVEHAPINDPDSPNRAHSVLRNLPNNDPDLTEVRFKLRKIFKIVLPLDA